MDVWTAWNGSGDESRYDSALLASGIWSVIVVDGGVSGGTDMDVDMDVDIPVLEVLDGAAKADAEEKDENAMNGAIASDAIFMLDGIIGVVVVVVVVVIDFDVVVVGGNLLRIPVVLILILILI